MPLHRGDTGTVKRVDPLGHVCVMVDAVGVIYRFTENELIPVASTAPEFEIGQLVEIARRDMTSYGQVGEIVEIKADLVRVEFDYPFKAISGRGIDAKFWYRPSSIALSTWVEMQ